jgi:hypothetical protein
MPCAIALHGLCLLTIYLGALAGQGLAGEPSLRSKTVYSVLREPLPPEELGTRESDKEVVVQAPTFTYGLHKATGVIGSSCSRPSPSSVLTRSRGPRCSRCRRTTAKTHIAAHPENRWLFQTRRCGKFSTRRVQQVVKVYAERAGVHATPHTFRHQAITWLTRTSGLADAELQLITGHFQRTSLQIYQHVAVDGQLAERYQQAMRDEDL